MQRNFLSAHGASAALVAEWLRPQNLLKLHLSFKVKKQISDEQDVSFGVRKSLTVFPAQTH